MTWNGSHNSLQGRQALITGSASGIGLATRGRFLAEGAFVIGVDRSIDSQGRPSAIAGHAELLELAADVGERTDREAIAAAVSELGGVSVIVHCAAVSVAGTSLTVRTEDWDQVLKVNLTAIVELNKLLIPLMPAGGGSIVLVGSQLGLVGTRNSLAYSASKGALVNLTRSMALELADASIRVNCLCAGTTETPFLQRSMSRTADYDANRRDVLSRVPLGRFARPDEIASAALFLASDESSYMTGATLVVDGGYTAW